ncbi:hypothetical protein [Streptomyces sp. NBC_01718]|uniref:hypothetical protein n=1 Tax=unclassified Streptomyces TaxID=2593676 RepID=UPI0030DF2674
MRSAVIADSAANDGTGNVNTVCSALHRLVAPPPFTAGTSQLAGSAHRGLAW